MTGREGEAGPADVAGRADVSGQDGEAGTSATVEVALDGEHHEFTWPPGTRLLDLLREKGLDAPFSCREGACSACACVLRKGNVTMLNNEILDQDDLDDGIILACLALPATAEVSVTYDD
jgi:3-ketosteroid 9alpha-monooxygenase subunit B